MRVTKRVQMQRLQAKLDQLLAAKDDANLEMNDDAFNAACDAIREVEDQMWILERGAIRGCSVTRELVGANCD